MQFPGMFGFFPVSIGTYYHFGGNLPQGLASSSPLLFFLELQTLVKVMFSENLVSTFSIDLKR